MTCRIRDSRVGPRGHFAGCRAITLLIGLVLTGAAGADAQTTPALVSPSYLCWRGRPLPDCHGFFLVEAQGVFPVAQTRRWVSYGGPAYSVSAFDWALEWNLGYMVNVADRWGLGGGLTLGTGSSGPLTGIKARARRWLGPELSLEAEAGLLLKDAAGGYGGTAQQGFTVDARLNAGDRGALFIRWDALTLDPLRGPEGAVLDEGGLHQALSVGVGTGSTWTVFGTGALALFYTILIATVRFD